MPVTSAVGHHSGGSQHNDQQKEVRREASKKTHFYRLFDYMKNPKQYTKYFVEIRT